MAESSNVWIAKHRHKVGVCPGCRVHLWADVTVDTEVRAPRLDAEGRAVANASASIVRVALSHECAGVNDA